MLLSPLSPCTVKKKRSRYGLEKHAIWIHYTLSDFMSVFAPWNCLWNEIIRLLTKQVLTKRVFFCMLTKRVLMKRAFTKRLLKVAHETSFLKHLTKRVLTKRVLTKDSELLNSKHWFNVVKYCVKYTFLRHNVVGVFYFTLSQLFVFLAKSGKDGLTMD